MSWVQSDIILTSERVDELLPGLTKGCEEAVEELIMGYVRYCWKILPGATPDQFSVGIAAMVELVRENQGKAVKHKNFTGYVKATVLTAVQTFKQRDHLIRIPKDAYRQGARLNLPPVEKSKRASIEHHQKKELYLELKEAMATLAETERKILILRSESYTFQEISDLLEIPKTTVVELSQSAQVRMQTLMRGH